MCNCGSLKYDHGSQTYDRRSQCVIVDHLGMIMDHKLVKHSMFKNFTLRVKMLAYLIVCKQIFSKFSLVRISKWVYKYNSNFKKLICKKKSHYFINILTKTVNIGLCY